MEFYFVSKNNLNSRSLKSNLFDTRVVFKLLRKGNNEVSRHLGEKDTN